MRSSSVLALSALLAAPAAAAPLHLYSGLALSPAGDRTATIERDAEPDAPSPRHGAIVVRAAADGRILSRIDPCASCGYTDPAFAADGRLAFVARDRAVGVARLMVADAGGRPREVARANGLIADPRWSPDDRTLAVLATVGARKEAGAVNAGAREIGEIGEAFDEQRLAVVPAAGGAALRFVSPADRYVYEYDWLPDGSGVVATTAPGNGDANWWVATIDAIDIATGRVRTIAKPELQANAPRVSPDGKTVAYIGGLMSDFGSVGGDVWTVPVAGGRPRNATPGYRGSFATLAWDAAGLRGSALVADKLAIVPVDPARGAAAPVWQAAVSAGDVAFARDRVAMVAQDWDHAPAIFAGPVAAPRAITRDNAAYPAIVTARSLTWKNGGFDVQGWLVGPRGASASARAPMVTMVHGGPAAATTPRFVWEDTNAALIRAGYWLFFPNPRGSYGQGEAFTQANRRDFGGGDLADDLAGVDAAIKAAPIDPERLGLMGGSYGGFMAMWANTQTNRFKAIHAMAGLSDWISYYGTNGINTWMIPYLGKSAYDDPEAYWRMSAVRYIRQAKTPTLITVGERDVEVPAGQSLEHWNALKAAGVPTTLVIYPDEGHRLVNPANIADRTKRTIAWFDRYLKGAQTR